MGALNCVIRCLVWATLPVTASVCSTACVAGRTLPEHVRSGFCSGVYADLRAVNVTEGEHEHVVRCLDDINQFFGNVYTRQQIYDYLLSEPDRFAPYVAQLIVWGSDYGQLNALDIAQVALVERQAELTPRSRAILLQGVVRGLKSSFALVRQRSNQVLREATGQDFGAISRRSSRLSRTEQDSVWAWECWVDSRYPFRIWPVAE